MYLLSTGSVPGMGSITVLHPVLKPSPQPLFLAIFSGTWISRPLFQFSSICLTVFLCRTFHTCSLGILGNFPGDFSKSIMVQEKWSRNGHFLSILPDLVSLSPVTPPALLSTTERWGSGITFSWQLHPSYSFPCSMGEFIGIGWDQFWPSRAAAGLPSQPWWLCCQHVCRGFVDLMEWGRRKPCHRFAETYYRKMLKCGLTAHIGKGSLNFSILAIKSAKTMSNMLKKHLIAQAGNWVTWYLNTRNVMALTADEVFLLHK